MKPVLPVILLLLGAFTLGSCSKEENINNAPANTVVGGIMSARINGAIWTATEGQTFITDDTILTVISTRDPKTDKLTDITLHIYGYHGPDTYALKDIESTFAVYTDNVTPYNADSGSIRIESDDAQYVRGSFHFQGSNKFGQVLVFTDGQFKVRKD